MGASIVDVPCGGLLLGVPCWRLFPCRRLLARCSLPEAAVLDVPCRRPSFLKRPKTKQKVFLRPISPAGALTGILNLNAPPGRADAHPCATALTPPSMALLPGSTSRFKTNQTREDQKHKDLRSFKRCCGCGGWVRGEVMGW